MRVVAPSALAGPASPAVKDASAAHVAVHSGGQAVPGENRAVVVAELVARQEAVISARQANYQENQEQLERTIKALNQAMRAVDHQLRFQRHETTGTIMVRIIDTTTNEVIREIPPQKILDMVGDMIQGLLVDEKV
jgi:flagellar protein FlaG